MRSVLVLVALLVVLAGLAIPTSHAQDKDRQHRITVFISDLHWGVGRKDVDGRGRYTAGAWHPMEDFRWTEEFSIFLEDLSATGRAHNAPVQLIVLGDMFELWQAADDKSCPIRKGSEDLGCDERGALQRLERVLGAHQKNIQLLRTFLNSGDNRLVIVPGNHDAALVFPGVAKRVIEEIGRGSNKVAVLAEGYWLSPDGRIFAEHGHQVKEDVNHFDKLPASCLDEQKQLVDCSEKGAFLRRPWGEQFVQAYYNQFELKYPIIDNVASEGEGIRYAVSEAKLIEVGAAVTRGLKFFLFGQSYDQFSQLLGDQQKRGLPAALGADPAYRPRWDIVRVRAGANASFLLGSFLNDKDHMVMEAKRLASAGKIDLAPTIGQLTDDELDRLCQYRYLKWRSRPADRRDPAELCPVTDPQEFQRLGAITRNLLHSDSELDRARLKQRAELVSKSHAPLSGKFDYYIWGHTHRADVRQVTTDEAGWNPRMINTGAWQRVASSRQLYKLYLDMKAASKEQVLQQEVDKLPPCYTYVYVGPYGKVEVPEPLLLTWYRDDKLKRWRTGDSCPRIYEADLPEPSPPESSG